MMSQVGFEPPSREFEAAAGDAKQGPTASTSPFCAASNCTPDPCFPRGALSVPVPRPPTHPGYDQPWCAPLSPLAAVEVPSPVQQDPTGALPSVGVSLESRDLWKKFHTYGTEMVITRPGRRMFPVLKVEVTGLKPNGYYMLLMDMVPLDEYRYRYLGRCWLPLGVVDPDDHPRPTLYLHEKGPSLGADWMAGPVSFANVKLTNQEVNSGKHMMLHSMRKYIPRIHVFAGSDVLQLDYRRFKTFIFPETSFIAVTAYQSEEVIALKIEHNPYARSFYTNGERRSNAKRLLDEESVSDEEFRAPKSKLICQANPEGSRSSPPGGRYPPALMAPTCARLTAGASPPTSSSTSAQSTTSSLWCPYAPVPRRPSNLTGPLTPSLQDWRLSMYHNHSTYGAQSQSCNTYPWSSYVSPYASTRRLQAEAVTSPPLSSTMTLPSYAVTPPSYALASPTCTTTSQVAGGPFWWNRYPSLRST